MGVDTVEKEGIDHKALCPVSLPVIEKRGVLAQPDTALTLCDNF